MKTLRWLLPLSLAANLALIALLATGLAARANRANAPRPAAPGKTAAPAAPDAAWSALQNLDLAAQRDRLRAAGFPPEILRAILAAEIRESFAARRKALDATQGNVTFWKVPRPDPATNAALRALSREEQQALKDLLGADADDARAASLRRQFPAFTSEQVDALVAIQQRYEEQRQQLYEAARSGYMINLTPDERAKMNALDKAMHAEFAAVLTPAQLEDYDLRTSSIANNLRFNLGNFELTEGEFRAVYRLKSAFQDQWSSFDYQTSSQNEQRVYMDANKKVDTDIAAALGPDRYAQYQRATDYNYRQTSLLVARLNLPAETTDSLYALQKDFTQRRQDVYRAVANPTSREQAADLMQQIGQQMTALQQDAVARATTLLGGNATAVEAYKQNGGQWLANLAPRVATPPPTPPRP